MGRMSEIDQTIKDIHNWFKDHVAYIVTVIFVFVMAVVIYGQADREVLEKENRINTIEERLQKQENYMHEVKADIDNLYEVIENANVCR